MTQSHPASPTMPHLSPAQLGASHYTAMRPRARISRPVFILPSLLGYCIGTANGARQGSSQPEGPSPEEEKPDDDPPREPAAMTAGSQREIRGGCLEAVTPTEQARRGTVGREVSRKKWGLQIPPKMRSSHSTETHATSDTMLPGLLATCAPFYHCSHSGSPPPAPACELRDRAQAQLCPLYQRQEQGLAGSAGAAGRLPRNKGGQSGMQDWAQLLQGGIFREPWTKSSPRAGR